MNRILRDRRLRACMKRHGIRYPGRALGEARRAGLAVSVACALLEQETAGGFNVFGHDPAPNGQTWGGKVTRAAYQRYKRYRGPSGRGGMQGVGPLQLTWWSIQDQADAIGGCWRLRPNMRVGFTHAAALIRQLGYAQGLARYNGTGPAAANYSVVVRDRARRWHNTLAQEVPR